MFTGEVDGWHDMTWRPRQVRPTKLNVWLTDCRSVSATVAVRSTFNLFDVVTETCFGGQLLLVAGVHHSSSNSLSPSNDNRCHFQPSKQEHDSRRWGCRMTWDYIVKESATLIHTSVRRSACDRVSCQGERPKWHSWHLLSFVLVTVASFRRRYLSIRHTSLTD